MAATRQLAFTILLLTAVLWSVTSVSAPLDETINQLIEQRLPNTTVSILVQEAGSNRTIYQRNQDKRLSPASSVKLYTAIAALYGLGPNYQFVTKLLQQSNHFFLRFSGSPTLTSDSLSELLTNITGDSVALTLDTSHFLRPFYPDGTSYDDLGWYYAAPDTAAILDNNMATFVLSPASQANQPITIKAKQTNPALELDNQLMTVDDAKADTCRIQIELASPNTLVLYGCMAKSARPKEVKLAVPNPVFRAKEWVKQALTKRGMAPKDPIKVGLTPNDAKEVGQVTSAPMLEIVSHMLKESDNLYANSLTKELGSTAGRGTYLDGVFAIKDIIQQRTGLDLDHVYLTDGLGTRYNLISARQLVALLNAAFEDKNMRTLLAKTLPIAGFSGSLQDRMIDTPLEGIVYAKTGSMHDISSLSGYLFNNQQKPLVFSIIINGIDKPLSIAKALEDDILLAIYQSETNKINK